MPTKGEDLEVSNKIHLPDKKKNARLFLEFEGGFYLSRVFFLLAGGSASSCRLGWLI